MGVSHKEQSFVVKHVRYSLKNTIFIHGSVEVQIV